MKIYTFERSGAAVTLFAVPGLGDPGVSRQLLTGSRVTANDIARAMLTDAGASPTDREVAEIALMLVPMSDGIHEIDEAIVRAYVRAGRGGNNRGESSR